MQLYVRWPDYAHRGYHPADIFLAHIFSIVAGIGRIENTQSLLHNGLVPAILGLPEFPHRDTLRTFLWRFNRKNVLALESAHNRLRAELFKRWGPLYSATIDADTTALMMYGNQEGAALGYVPKLRHRKPSYAPILSSEAHTGLSLGLELRSGNVHSTTGAWAFLKEQLAKLPSTVASSRIRVRLDGGFYDKDILLKLDEERLGYLVVARMTPSLKRRMIAARYHEFARGWEAAEFAYPVTGFRKEHRFVAVRRPVTLEPEDVRNRLFTFRRHTYHRALAVGRLDISPESCYRFYCDRAIQELLIREFKDSYGLAQIPTRSFHANAAYMEMILWAYNLVRAFQFLCLPKELQSWTLPTVRRELWSLPAEWVRHGNQNILSLPAKYPNQDLFSKIEQAASAVKPLF